MDLTILAQPKRSHRNLILWLMLIIIFGPVLFAYILIQKNQHYHLRLMNHGDLITPPIQIEKAITTDKPLVGQWWLVYVGPKQCEEAEFKQVYQMRQIRTSLNKGAPPFRALIFKFINE